MTTLSIKRFCNGRLRNEWFCSPWPYYFARRLADFDIFLTQAIFIFYRMNAESDKDVIFTNVRKFFKLQSIFRTKKTTQDSSQIKSRQGFAHSLTLNVKRSLKSNIFCLQKRAFLSNQICFQLNRQLQRPYYRVQTANVTFASFFNAPFFL